MKTLLVIALALCCAACAPSVEETKPEDANDLVNGLHYVKAKNGLCFGVATTSRISGKFDVAYNVVLVSVECERVGL